MVTLRVVPSNYLQRTALIVDINNNINKLSTFVYILKPLTKFERNFNYIKKIFFIPRTINVIEK